MKTKILQIYYDQNSQSKLDKGFIPLNNIDKNTELFENKVIYDFYLSELYKDVDFLGVLSWRFFEKTGYNSKQVYEILTKNNYKSFSFMPRRCENYAGPYHRTGFGNVHELIKQIDRTDILKVKLKHYKPAVNVWCNYFICTPDVFEKYVKNYLEPVVKHFAKKENQKYLLLTEKHRGKPCAAMTFFLEGLYSVFIEQEKINHKLIEPNYK